jgi:DNA repair exonuclease SbcCD ATPase subunit
MQRSAILVLIMLLCSASTVRAEFYRWVDKEGKEFFTNDREKIPHEYRTGSSLVKPDESRVSVDDRSTASKKSAARFTEHKDKNGRGEEYWHKRADKLRKELNDLQTKYDHLVEREQEYERQHPTVIGKKDKTAASQSMKKRELEKKIATAKRKLDVELPEEARRADAYPGWIRE